MSAIYGMLRFDGTEVDRREIERMGAAMAVRGPDGRAEQIDGALALGHNLMRVTHEDALEAQPLYDRDAGLMLVADLRLDNRMELAAALGISPADLAISPDSALLLRAYAAWGEQCTDRLLGDFAFALWDVRARRLMLGRDHMGQRQVHYHHGRDFIAFATDIKALWAVSGVPRAMQEAWLARRAFRGVERPAGQTAFDGISGVCGGTTMTIMANGTASVRRYWQPHADPRHLGHDEAYYVAAYRAVLEEAVACRVRRLDRPPGLLLSGGFDSSAVAGLAGPALAGAGRRMIAASSVAPAGASEKRDARRWVDYCARDMPHLDVRYVTAEGGNPIAGMDRVFAETGLGVNGFHPVEEALFGAVAAGGGRLVMDGNGGDYTLNPRGADALAWIAATGRIGLLAREIAAHRRMTGESWRRTIVNRLVQPMLPAAVMTLWHAVRRRLRPPPPAVLLDPAFLARLGGDGVVSRAAIWRGDRPDLSPGERRTKLLKRLAEAPGASQSTAAASHQLDMTKPFHDKRVVELALALPRHLDVRGGRSRYLATRALADIYPVEFRNRSRINDELWPNYMAAVEANASDMVSELERLQGTSIASRVDVARAAELLSDLPRDARTARRNADLAIRTLLLARYIEWFDRRNA